MNVDAKFQLEKVCSKRNSGRPVLENVYLDLSDPAEPVACATDSYMLAVVPATVGDDDTSGLVPVEALVAARKQAPSELVANVRVELASASGTASFPRPDGQFPNWRKLTPSEEPVYRIALNAELLHKLAQALGCAKNAPVVLELGANALKPIRVEGVDGAHGLLMPVRTDRGGLTALGEDLRKQAAEEAAAA